MLYALSLTGVTNVLNSINIVTKYHIFSTKQANYGLRDKIHTKTNEFNWNSIHSNWNRFIRWFSCITKTVGCLVLSLLRSKCADCYCCYYCYCCCCLFVTHKISSHRNLIFVREIANELRIQWTYSEWLNDDCWWLRIKCNHTQCLVSLYRHTLTLCVSTNTI